MSILDELLIACSTDCATEQLPSISDPCNPEVWYGRANEILFVPCTEQIDQSWIMNLGNWQRVFHDTGFMGRKTGKGIGSYTQVNATAIDTGANCGIPTLVGTKTTWELSYRKVIIDRSTQLTTHTFANTLQTGALHQYKLFVRYCDAVDMILPIGKVALSKFNSTLPEGVDDFMTIEYGFQWKQTGIPTPILVPGLGAVLQ
ncbi:hypothetical protein [Chryseobacterium fistulae]|uniref:Uncharacterized protein n=1 Tax=Chryseobacterium fistulae TaxID=2675058 RepID=A0A6N4XSF9_9FLAO|nr:hypothetical protein [Chryseobacterium fistulae]CAA7387086.1 hypothetical protein CHRY9393_01388 [Chryseobacterium fistulae]